MKKYTLYIHEVHSFTAEVEAESVEHARDMWNRYLVDGYPQIDVVEDEHYYDGYHLDDIQESEYEPRTMTATDAINLKIGLMPDALPEIEN